MKKIYICSPLRGDLEKNIERALDHCREVSELGYLPIAPHAYFTRFLDDTVPVERDRGIAMALELLPVCDELWYFAEKPSEGMLAEIELAKELGIPVRDAIFAYVAADHNVEQDTVGSRVKSLQDRLQELSNSSPASAQESDKMNTAKAAIDMLNSILGPELTASLLGGALSEALKESMKHRNRNTSGSPNPQRRR